MENEDIGLTDWQIKRIREILIHRPVRKTGMGRKGKYKKKKGWPNAYDWDVFDVIDEIFASASMAEAMFISKADIDGRIRASLIEEYNVARGAGRLSMRIHRKRKLLNQIKWTEELDDINDGLI